MNYSELNKIDLTDCQTLFLDRDGVINEHRPGDYVKSMHEFKFNPSFLSNIEKWSAQCKYIIIVTNQRGVGRGLMTERQLQRIHKNMIIEIEAFGGRIDKVYSCIDIDENSKNRKPNIGMGLKAKKDFPDIDFNKAVMLGDSVGDEIFARRLGLKFIMIQNEG